MRVDQSDLAGGPDRANMACCVRSAPDDPGTTGRDQGKAVGGDGLPDSSRVSPDAASRIERTVVYRNAVDVAYRQYVTDHSYTDSGFATPEAPAEYELTGARGPASGRDFDPEKAGGPIRELDAGKARITDEGVQEATAHLQRFTGGGPLEVPEQGMIDRLTSIAAGDIGPTSYDLNFYTHELDEAARYARLGFGPESGVDIGSPAMYDVWNDVHTAALEDYGVRGADLFYPGLEP